MFAKHWQKAGVNHLKSGKTKTSKWKKLITPEEPKAPTRHQHLELLGRQSIAADSKTQSLSFDCPISVGAKTSGQSALEVLLHWLVELDLTLR